MMPEGPLTLTQTTALFGMPILVLAILVAFCRLLIGPTTADRVLALDLVSILTVGLIGLHALVTRTVAYLDVAVIVALVVFMGTVAFARHLTWRWGRKGDQET